MAGKGTTCVDDMEQEEEYADINDDWNDEQDLVKKATAQIATLEGELQGRQQMLNDLESKPLAEEEIDGQEANKDKLDKDLDMLETQINDM